MNKIFFITKGKYFSSIISYRQSKQQWFCRKRKPRLPRKNHSTKRRLTQEKNHKLSKASNKNSTEEMDLLENFTRLTALDVPLECQSCSKIFNSHLDLGLHSREHSIDETYSCQLCKYKNKSLKLFRNHINNHDQYKCQKCKRTFKFKMSALKHSKSHPPEFIECQICGKKLKRDSFKNHQKKMHSEKSQEDTFKCTLCDKTYLCKTSLRSHYSHNHRELGIDVSVVCDVCGKRLSCKNKFLQHQRTHTGERPFSCTVCSRRFTTKEILLSHTRVHTGEKPFECKYCGKKFAHDGPFRYHIRTHTGEKLHNCPLCKKGFISKANMRIHVKSCDGSLNKN
ncbi:unnamed protein product [Acanthoscelides obtectus]|uniref:C2H2-type domain-containing protein n=1 Tax=Acanthoscelides obtectus TaxID=200917 RepID=A0A9P0KNG3_ACAOB|nr:unnamed protein product [Acanthoscelides obtectus]CAK1675612.1 Zinc finger protein 782 [Acanthoscelides obtectus]